MSISSPELTGRITGIDKLNELMDQLPAGKAYHDASAGLLLCEDFYFLAYSIQDENITPDVQEFVTVALSQAFDANQLDVFTGQMLEQAKQNNTAYGIDYFYSLHLAAQSLLETPEYQTYHLAYAQLRKGNPTILHEMDQLSMAMRVQAFQISNQLKEHHQHLKTGKLC